MQENIVITYTLSELKEQFPDGYASALRHWQDSQTEIPWMDETIDSLKAVCNAAGVTLRDWSLGAYSRNNYILVSFGNDDVESFTGKRASAWLENNLFGPLRISFTARNRWEQAKFNKGYSSRPVFYYSAGHVPPCPLTGYCADEDYLDALRKAIREGETLKDAFTGLADVCQTLLENEAEHARSEESFVEANGDDQFTAEGERFN